ncbi:MAG TPA: glycosyltransferase [Candidatus Saccharimonadia bacterium]
MHIAIFLDQPETTLGGLQNSVQLQKKYLERLGHTVTLCCPATKADQPSPAHIRVPSWHLQGEYRMYIPTKRKLKALDAQFAQLPPIDIVHIQADYWAAILGFAFAKRHNLPTVITYHTNVAFTAAKLLGPVLGGLLNCGLAASSAYMLGPARAGAWTDAWTQVRNLAAHADLVLTPSKHFARSLQEHGVRQPVEVMSNGIDDDVLASVTRTPAPEPTFIWLGRLSQEKRFMELLAAIAAADVPARYEIFGTGALLQPGRQFVARHHLQGRVHFNGHKSYQDVMTAIASADALVQTSIGFETQGMTVLEAAMLGTPSILSDKLIAEDFPPDAYYLVADDSINALADSLRKVYAELKAGTHHRVVMDADNDYRQSRMSARAVSLYQKLLVSHLKERK